MVTSLELGSHLPLCGKWYMSTLSMVEIKTFRVWEIATEHKLVIESVRYTPRSISESGTPLQPTAAFPQACRDV